MSHYIVGIDLGTTHTVVAYAPRKGARGGVPAVQLLEIEQLVAPGEVAALPLLPSVRYHPAAGELAAGVRAGAPALGEDQRGSGGAAGGDRGGGRAPAFLPGRTDRRTL